MTDKEKKSLFLELENLTTEQRNPKSHNIDALSTLEILKTINDEDNDVPAAVAKEIPYIATSRRINNQTHLRKGEDCCTSEQEQAEESEFLMPQNARLTFGTPYRI